MIICTNKNQNHKINVQNKDYIEMKQQVNSQTSTPRNTNRYMIKEKAQKKLKTLIIFTILIINGLINKRNEL